MNPREVELGAKLHIEGECCQAFVCRICGAVRHEEGLSPRAIVTICEKCPFEEEHWALRGTHILDARSRVIGKRLSFIEVRWDDWVRRLGKAVEVSLAEIDSLSLRSALKMPTDIEEIRTAARTLEDLIRVNLTT